MGIDTLRLIYAGEPGSERERSFAGFLEERAASVRSIDLATLPTADLSGGDVLIVDGEALKSSTPTGLSLEALSLPVVLVGGTGGKVADELGLKLGWGYG